MPTYPLSLYAPLIGPPTAWGYFAVLHWISACVWGLSHACRLHDKAHCQTGAVVAVHCLRDASS